MIEANVVPGGTKPPSRRRGGVAYYLASVTLGLILGVGLIELASFVLLAYDDGHFVSAKTRFTNSTNTFLSAITQSDPSHCQYIDTLFPHPYVGFVHHGNPPCGVAKINNVGLFGADFPSEHRADRFVILETGGSVALHMGQMDEGKPRYLEEILNREYVSPTGKPFLVLNGGDGAWKQPQQLFLFLQYADAVDGVVTLDGFNEHYMFTSEERFEYPANNFVQVNPLAAQDFSVIVRLWILGKLARGIENSPVLTRSNTAYLLLRYVRNSFPKSPERKTSVESIFALPQQWNKERRFTWALEQYQKYILAMNSVAGQHHVLTSFFIQPAPAVGKQLTPRERALVGDLSYGNDYQRMTDGLLSLISKGVPIHSLLHVVDSSKESLYADPIHMDDSPPGGSPGYRLMAQEMARRIAEDWKLKRK